jgi:hypothetical protein
MWAARWPRTNSIRFPIRQIRSIRISKAVNAFMARPCRNGNRRSGWLQQLRNTEKNGSNGLNEEGRGRASLQLLQLPTKKYGCAYARSLLEHRFDLTNA